MKAKSIFATTLSDEVITSNALSLLQAEQLFLYFKNNPLFRWFDANNDCEDRANAICILLDEWRVSNYKGWIFSGYVFRKKGFLKNLWRYHVAPAIPVMEKNNITLYIIDPATSDKLIKMEDWAENVTDNPYCYYVVKKGELYIFNGGKIKKDNWYKRDKRNYKWTMQGLAGINGISIKGKAVLCFNKTRVKRTAELFKKVMKEKPTFLNQV